MTPDMFTGPFGIIFGILTLIVAIMWLLLPIAIVQIHRKTIELVDIQRQILYELRQLNSGVSEIVEEEPQKHR